MSYYGFTGIYTKSPRYRHPDGTVTTARPAEILAWHEECAHKAFAVDTSVAGWGSWHHGDTGISWSPGRYSANHYPCAACGESV
jgi:hypothetical protein